MSVTLDMMATWRRPRAIMRKQLRMGQREDRAIAYVLGACFMVFVSQWPELSRQAYLDPEVPLQARIGGALMAWLFIMPLVLYALAAVARLLAMPFGGQGTWYTARLALFWSLLATTPAWLFWGLVRGFVGPGPAETIVGAGLFFSILALWGICTREAEQNPTGVEATAA